MRVQILLITATLLQAQTPSPDFRIQLRLAESRAYQQTERVTVEIRTTPQPKPEQQFNPYVPPDRPAFQWQFVGFLVDPPFSDDKRQCGAPEKPCTRASFSGSGGIVWSGPLDIDLNRDRSSPDLNEYAPSRIRPGTYRVSLLARKLVRTSTGPLSATYGAANPSETMTSNSVDLQVLPVTDSWISQTISSTSHTIRTSSDFQQTQAAARQLASLETAVAWRALLDLLPLQEASLLTGLARTAQPQEVCELLQARIPAPEQAVTAQYLSTLTTLCTQANVPPPAMPTVTATISSIPVMAARAPDPELQVYFEKQRQYFEDIRQRSVNTLAASLANKQPGPQREALGALLQYLNQLQHDRPRRAMPAWSSEIASRLTIALPLMSSQDRRTLIPLFASVLPTASAAPTFESVLNSWKPGMNFEESSEALRALYRVAPGRAQARIREELTKSPTWLTPQILDLLPASEVPPMDDALLEALQTSRDLLPAAAIARYATPAALPRVRAAYEAMTQPCQPELVAYFLRADPAYAGRVLRATANRYCLPQYFQRTAAILMNSTLEEFIASYLLQDAVFIKTGAATALGKYGSEAAQKPLWDTLRYFHEYWKGKDSELAKNGESLMQEEQLAEALARGRSWVATEKDLHEIEDLCIGERCKYAARQALQAWRAPMRLEVHGGTVGPYGSIAQYTVASLEELETKLSMFPAGSSFVMSVSGPSHEAIENRLRDVAADKGLLLQTY